MNHFFILILIIISYAGLRGHEQEDSSKKNYRIAIFDFKQGSGVSIQEARDITDIIRTEMINQNAFTILDRENLKKVLEEQKNIQLGLCDTTDCNIRLGRLLGANKIMTGKIFRLGKTFHINAYITDIEKGISELAERETSSSIDRIPSAVEKLSSKITFLILNPGKQTLPDESNYEANSDPEPMKNNDARGDLNETALYFSLLIPGFGQFYNGYAFKGSLFFLSFFGVVALDIHYQREYNSSHRSYRQANSLVSNSYLQRSSLLYAYTESIKENSEKEMNHAATQLVYSYIATFLIYGLNVMDALFTTEANRSSSLNLKDNAGFFMHSRMEAYPQNVNRNIVYTVGYLFEF